ncbi:MAG TPA: helix-turn-helix domain-containing protein [Acidimicrobiales bacterium]|nr:helix-turn-helix domain-containing protein [Acidimicrobiales bacterium]
MERPPAPDPAFPAAAVPLADPGDPVDPRDPVEVGERGRGSSRAALVAAALEEFSAKGYEAATVAGIADRAGVTTGAVYAHFEGKLDLLVETLGVRTANEFMRTIAAAAARPWTELVSLLGHELGRPPDRRGLLGLDVIVVARRDPVVAATLRTGLEGYLAAMATSAELGIEAGLLDPAVVPADLARLFALVSFGVLVFTALGEELPSEGAFRRVVDLLLQSEGPADGDVNGEAPPAALARVRTRAALADRARQRLDDGIAEAVAAGHSLRQVGAAAGLSHERVRRLLQERGVDPG